MIEKTPGSLERLRTIGAVALDMDGTTYLGGRLLPGAAAIVDLTARRGIPCIFLTNNSSKSRAEYREKLGRLGLAAAPDAVMTSGEATIRWVLRARPDARVLLLATPSFEAEVRDAGIALVPLDRAAEADLAILAYDTTLTFARLAAICDHVRAGRTFVATHPDVNCPVEGGCLPDVGAFLACIRASTGRGPDLVVGKPGELMVAALAERVSLPPERIACVGDRLYTDVAMARRSGMLGILVLSGETRIADLDGSEFQPDLVADDLADVVSALA
ncbi:MAG: HAD-IIA family hydrolase [Deltaproteobacteria bacterium]|nr:HAD-IIA family hydrolase [Deltaproteobacteria bacterium]